MGLAWAVRFLFEGEVKHRQMNGNNGWKQPIQEFAYWFNNGGSTVCLPDFFSSIQEFRDKILTNSHARDLRLQLTFQLV